MADRFAHLTHREVHILEGLGPHTRGMPSNSWPEFLAYISPAVVALLYATARWAESRARITSEVARSISRELEQASDRERAWRENSDWEPGAPDRRRSSTRETTCTSPGETEHDEHQGDDEDPPFPSQRRPE